MSAERKTIDLPCRHCGEITTDWHDRHEWRQKDGTIRLSKATVCAGCQEADRDEKARRYRDRFAQRGNKATEA